MECLKEFIRDKNKTRSKSNQISVNWVNITK